MKANRALIFAAGIFLLACSCNKQPAKTFKPTYSGFDLPSDHPAQAVMISGTMNFQNVPVDDVLKIYQELSGRTVIRGPLPAAQITLRNQTPLSRVQALQMLDTMLAQNGIAMILSGDDAVKAVPVDQATSESPPEITLPWEQLPESSSCMTRTVQLKNLKAIDVVPMLMPLSGLPHSIFVIQDQNLLTLRDYSSNIRQELQLLEKLDRK